MKAKITGKRTGQKRFSSMHYPRLKKESWGDVLWVPEVYRYIWNRDIEIDVVKSLDPRFDYKFIFRKRVYWINKEFLDISGRLEDTLFEVDIY